MREYHVGRLFSKRYPADLHPPHPILRYIRQRSHAIRSTLSYSHRDPLDLEVLFGEMDIGIVNMDRESSISQHYRRNKVLSVLPSRFYTTARSKQAVRVIPRSDGLTGMEYVLDFRKILPEFSMQSELSYLRSKPIIRFYRGNTSSN